MTPLLTGLLVGLILACVVYWAVHRLEAAFNLPPQVVVVFDVLLVVVFVGYLLRTAGWMP